MDFSLAFFIIIVSLIQSIFGVGVLLFGTPILLILGYDFVNALNLLLPISIFINLFQISKDYSYINLSYYKKLIVFSIPPIIILLWFTLELDINSSVIIGIFLIFISLKPLSRNIAQIIEVLFNYQRTYLVIQGVIHGLTNLGGSLLTSNIFALNLKKDETRATISISYFTFAIFQIITLMYMGKLIYIEIELILLGIFTYLLCERFIYKKISVITYEKIFAVFLFISGITLFLKELI
jgi:uncharacterized membrane protein YfcA